MCALWPWRYEHGSKSWHTLGSRIAFVWNIYYQDQTWQWGFMARTRLLDMCTVTLTLEIWPWVMDNNCVKYYSDRASWYEVMARTWCEQTDRQGETYISTLDERQLVRYHNSSLKPTGTLKHMVTSYVYSTCTLPFSWQLEFFTSPCSGKYVYGR